MGTLYSIKFKVSNEHEQKQFGKAFADIFQLSKRLLDSQDNARVKIFLTEIVGWDPTDRLWLKCENDSVCIKASGPAVYIRKSDANNFGQLVYDFGKEYPARSAYLTAVISIFCHYFPKAKFSDDLWGMDDEFTEGLSLAAVVNPAIVNNPVMCEEEDEEYVGLHPSTSSICKALRHDFSHRRDVA